MTLPDERYRAIQATGDFLLRLAAHPKVTPGVPKRIREEAKSLLRHYPGSWDLAMLEKKCPEVLQQRMEPLHRMVASYESQTPEPEDTEGQELIRGYRET
jgi:hypothetical protein